VSPLEQLFRLELDFHRRLRTQAPGTADAASLHTSYALQSGYEPLVRAIGAVSPHDIEEALQGALKGTTLTFMITSALALILLFGVHLVSERSRKELHRRAAWLSTTLRSMGDAVIATDGDGRVIFLNPVAETLTGWVRDEAKGKPIEHIFLITNQQTGETAENPVTRVLREGVVVGLANHTVLTAKDGTSRPIAEGISLLDSCLFPAGAKR
jgi:PAS domain S-box-containing protein